MSIKIRLAAAEDAENLLDIYRPYVLNTAITFEYEVPTAEDFEGRIKNTLEKYPYIAAEKDGEIVGYAYASELKGRKAYDWSCETSIYVKKQVHGEGIGRILYEELERILRLQNITNINACIAYADPEDEYLTNDSQSFHEHMGFSLVGRFHKCANKFGNWYDMIWMEKWIGEHGENVPEIIPFSEMQLDCI